MAADKKEQHEKDDVLGPTYEPGKPDEPVKWRQKLQNREEMLKYLRSAERYWFGTGVGSEKRKTDA
jgi:hypothetical protein